MKIALITIWHCGNYGAEMQAYATVKALKKIGHEVEIIDFRLDDSPRISFKQKLARLFEAVSPQRRKFNSFWRNFISFKSRHYRSLNELRQHPPIADIYIVGSDQVWNEEITKEKAAAYFLDFGKKSTRRVSFSSSLGVSHWNGTLELTQIASKRLKEFYCISCREASAAKVIKQTFQIDNIINTIDPTLLFDNYKEITGILKNREIITYYPLNPSDKALLPLCTTIAREFNLKICNANPYTQIPFTSLSWNRNSIKEWIKSIAEAKIVITQSFHGMAFSLIHQRQFIVVNLSKNGRESRILDLLDQLGLKNRYFETIEDIIPSGILGQDINYEDIGIKLEKLRNTSWNYLKTATT